MTIGEKIFELRRSKGVSQETMAFDLAVSRQAVSKWETDQSIPDLDKIRALADYFEVSIDYLVNDVKSEDITEKKESIDLNKTNYAKRITRIMLKTSIAFNILQFVLIVYITIFQKWFLTGVGNHDDLPFVFPFGIYIEYVIFNGFYLFVAFYLLKQLREDTKIVKDKIVFLIIYASLTILEFFFGYIETAIMNLFGDEKLRLYLEIVMQLQRHSVGLVLANIMVIISLVIVLVVKINDPTKYKLPTVIKEYKARDSVFSFLIGLFLGIPGLLFEIIWLLDAKTDNEFRFKKMRFWYIMGVVVNIVCWLIDLIIRIIIN